jgi:hypothetical protein
MSKKRGIMQKIKEQIISFIKEIKSKSDVSTGPVDIEITSESIDEQKKFKYSRNVEYPSNKNDCSNKDSKKNC